MDLNHLFLEELRKIQEEEQNRRMHFKEVYKLYSNSPRQKICLDLKVVKFCF